MARKGSQKGYVSAGINSTVAKKHRGKPTETEKFMNKFRAYIAGQDPWITIDNPNKNETNKPRIRVRASTYFKERKEYWMKSRKVEGDEIDA